MQLTLPTILALAGQCAPTVAPQTVAAIVRTESSGSSFAINVNGTRQPPPPQSEAEAVALAQRYVSAGYSVDLGLGQINSRNMRRLGLTWETVFDPCTNIGALGRVLTGNYQAALTGRDPQSALRIALSLYNTGSSSRGFRNGYVGRVVGNAGVMEPTPTSGSPLIAATNDVRPSIIVENSEPAAMVASVSLPPPAWNLFKRAAHLRRTAIASETTGRTSVWSD